MTIPTGLRRPDVYTDINTNTQRSGLPDNRQHVLFVTADTTGATSPIPIYDAAGAKASFGAGSQAVRMITAAIKTNSLVDVEALRASTTAVNTVTLATFAGGGAGDPIWYYGAVVNDGLATGHAVLSFSLNGGAPQSILLDREAFTLNQRLLISTGGGAGAVTDFNDDLAIRALEIGVSFVQSTEIPADGTFTLTLTRLSSAPQTVQFLPSLGASLDVATALGIANQTFSFTNADDVFDTIAPLGHTIIVVPAPITLEADALAWAQHLNFVSSSTEQRDAILIVPFADIADAEAFAALAPVETSYRIVAACYHGATGQEPEIAACMAAALADSADPALPFNGVNLTGLTPVEKQYELTNTRIEQALQNGVCVIRTGADGVPEIVRAITTYAKTPEGEDDDLLLDVNGALVLAYVRKTMRQVIKQQPRRKNTAQQRRNLRTLLLTTAKKLDDAEILQNVDARKDALTVDADPNDAYRVNCRIPSDWVRGMHVIGVTLDVF